jgi:DNA (cytosine-5)-methyltransferase 1
VNSPVASPVWAGTTYPQTDRPLRIGSMCSGYGGLDAAVQAVLGGELAWVADPDLGAGAILAHHHPDVPNLNDITTVDWTKVEPIDVLTAGYPCQPFSNAGLRKGVEDERHIWPYIATALRVLRPRYAIFENVAGHLRRGFDTVLADLAALGFDAEWRTVRASDVGAPHRRERLFILATAADAQSDGRNEWRTESAGEQRRPDAALGGAPAPADAGRSGLEGVRLRRAASERRDPAANTDRDALREQPVAQPGRRSEALTGLPRLKWGDYEPAIRRWEHVIGRPAPRPTEPGRNGERLAPRFVEFLMGLPAGHVTDVPGLSRNQQLKALGNGVVIQQAVAALSLLLNALQEAAA